MCPKNKQKTPHNVSIFEGTRESLCSKYNSQIDSATLGFMLIQHTSVSSKTSEENN